MKNQVVKNSMVRAGVVLLGASGLVGLTATQAQAACPAAPKVSTATGQADKVVASGGLTLRTSPYTDSGCVKRTLANGTALTAYCWAVGSSVPGVGGTWSFVKVSSNKDYGWVNDHYLQNQGADDHCPT